MSDLVPEKRLDKNNRLVTKYVRPTKAEKNQHAPAPSVAKTLAGAPTAREISKKHNVSLRDETLNLMDMMLPKYRRQLSDTSLSGFLSVRTALQNRGGGITLACLILEAEKFSDSMTQGDADDPVPFFFLAASVEETYKNNNKLKATPTGVPTKRHIQIVNGTFLAKMLADTELVHNTAIDKDAETVINNFRFIQPAAPLLLLRARMEGQYIVDEALATAEFVSRYPGRLDEIMNVVREREMYDEQLIANVLENPSSALSEGTL